VKNPGLGSYAAQPFFPIPPPHSVQPSISGTSKATPTSKTKEQTMAIRDGGDIENIETTENILSVSPGLDGIYVTFRVHGSEGTRTYRYDISVEELLDLAPEIAEIGGIAAL
jgi:hypothetical protein